MMHDWISSQESHGLPIYTSVDIRDSGFKVSVVDTNLFPAGFNNISPKDWVNAQFQLKKYLTSYAPHTQNILLITEEHTRNKWYLDNVFCLRSLLQNAGFSVTIATFLNPEKDHICQEEFAIELETASYGMISIRCLHHYLDCFRKGQVSIDAIVFNNDLTDGVPERMKDLTVPCFPRSELGWHSRQKSRHFYFANQVIDDFCHQFNLDPWLYKSLFSTVSEGAINEESDRESLATCSEKLFEEIRDHYLTHHIETPPTIFLKSDTGTYGMGVLSIRTSQDIRELNRKARNNLSKGKGSKVIDHFLLQEGVPTSLRINQEVAEPCLYLINNQLIGAFYRLNSLKSDTDNLNSQGMHFLPIDLETAPESFKAYAILARLSGLAAMKEQQELKL